MQKNYIKCICRQNWLLVKTLSQREIADILFSTLSNNFTFIHNDLHLTSTHRFVLYIWHTFLVFLVMKNNIIINNQHIFNATYIKKLNFPHNNLSRKLKLFKKTLLKTSLSNFPILPQCFQKLYALETSKCVCMWERVKNVG